MNPKGKYLNKVYLASDVYAVCLQHSLTTEKEEVMGMLIGDVDENQRVAYISANIILSRSDKQPDRVEISPEQLLVASTFAENMTDKFNKPLRVVGWYHSHPHITVWPSHVDLKTQDMYQLMDPLFVGLIFSVYQNGTGSTGNHCQVTCFQAMGEGPDYHRREIELEFENRQLQKCNLQSIASLPKILVQEEQQRHMKEMGNNCNEIITNIHNEALKTMVVADIVSKVAKPLFEDLEARLHTVKLRIEQLKKIKESLTTKPIESK